MEGADLGVDWYGCTDDDREFIGEHAGAEHRVPRTTAGENLARFCAHHGWPRVLRRLAEQGVNLTSRHARDYGFVGGTAAVLAAAGR